MKPIKISPQAPRMTADSQKRLLAYTTAAGIGAFFAGQSAEAQATLSLALGPYPHILAPGAGTGSYKTYFYFDVDGNGSLDFNLAVSPTRVDIGIFSNKVLNPSPHAYLIPWTVGSTVNSSGSEPTYRRWLATKDFNNFPSAGALGFEFKSDVSGGEQSHYGYLTVQVNGSSGNFTATVSDLYWNMTPNAGLAVGVVPEPSALALLAAGIGGLAIRRMRRAQVK
jgi:hypothetical protein